MLLEEKLITEEQIKQAVIERQRSGERLGQVLVKLNFIDETTLLRLLSTQYKLKVLPASKIPEKVEGISLRLQRTMQHYNAKVIAYKKKRNIVIIGIEDPTNEFLIETIMYQVQPLKPVFVLIDKAN